MRTCVALALASILTSAPALAQDDEDEDKGKDEDEKEEKSGGSGMDGSDPAYTETSDKGPYAPKGKTGKLAESKNAEVEVEEILKAKPRDKLVLFGEVFAGFGSTPLPGPAAAGTSPDATVFTLLVGGGYDISPAFTAGIRIPWSTASIDGTAGGEGFSDNAFGSPELLGEYRVSLSPITTLPILFGLGIPLAQGNPDPSAIEIGPQRKSAVNALADAAQGWRDGELYMPKRLPIVLGAGIRHQRKALDAYASSKFVFGINLGTEITNPDLFATGGGGELKVNSVSMRNVTLAGATYVFLKKPQLWGGVDTWMVIEMMDPVAYESIESVETPSPFEFVLEPRLGAMFGQLRPSLGLVVPLGGELGDAGMIGLRIHADYAF